MTLKPAMVFFFLNYYQCGVRTMISDKSVLFHTSTESERPSAIAFGERPWLKDSFIRGGRQRRGGTFVERELAQRFGATIFSNAKDTLAAATQRASPIDFANVIKDYNNFGVLGFQMVLF